LIGRYFVQSLLAHLSVKAAAETINWSPVRPDFNKVFSNSRFIYETLAHAVSTSLTQTDRASPFMTFLGTSLSIAPFFVSGSVLFRSLNKFTHFSYI
jgi:hypothetical protein